MAIRALSAGAVLLAWMTCDLAGAAAQRAPLQLLPQAETAKAPARSTASKRAPSKVAPSKSAPTRKARAQNAQTRTAQAQTEQAKSATSKTARTVRSNSAKATSVRAPRAKLVAAIHPKPQAKTARTAPQPAPQRRPAASAPPGKASAPNSRRMTVSVPRQNHTAAARPAPPPTGSRGRAGVATTPFRPVAARPTATSIAAPAQSPAKASEAPRAQAVDNVMRGTDSVSLVAKLPWWRNDRLSPVIYGSAAAESAVIAAADAWLVARGAGSDAAVALGFGDESIAVADAGDLNDIDLAAASTNAPPLPTFLESLKALIGGAVAAMVRLFV